MQFSEIQVANKCLFVGTDERTDSQTKVQTYIRADKRPGWTDDQADGSRDRHTDRQIDRQDRLVFIQSYNHSFSQLGNCNSEIRSKN